MRTRILCIDDNPDIADTEAILLSLAGFEARSCYGGWDALAVAEVFCPSIYLIDINMPGMNGDDLAARLRERAPDNPPHLIAVTARSSDVDGNWIKWFDGYLFKPVVTENLLAAVSFGNSHTTPTSRICALRVLPHDPPALGITS